MKYFKLVADGEDNLEIVHVKKAYPLTLNNINLFVHKETDGWRCTEVTTGLIVVQYSITKEDVIRETQDFISEYGVERIESKIKEAYKKNKEVIERITKPIKPKITNMVEI